MDGRKQSCTPRMMFVDPRMRHYVEAALTSTTPIKNLYRDLVDRGKKRTRFWVYVNLRRDGSAYVGQTGISVEARFIQHQIRDSIEHLHTVCRVELASRAEACGLEQALRRVLTDAGLSVTIQHGPAQRRRRTTGSPLATRSSSAQ